MGKSQLDMVIEESLHILREEKYKLRTFQTNLLIRVDPDYGIEETTQDIRSLPGVTVVTALDSQFRANTGVYDSLVRIKFHPQSDSRPAADYVLKELIPAINSSKIPGVRVVRQTTKTEPLE